MADGDRRLDQETAARRALHAQQPGGCAADRDGLVGLRGRWAGMSGVGGPDGRFGVSRQALLRWCRERPGLDAAGSLEEVDDAVLVAGGALPVPLLSGLRR